MIKPFADDEAAASIGNLEIENGTRRVVISGTVEIARDATGLKRARALKSLADRPFIELETKDARRGNAPAPPAPAADQVVNPSAWPGDTPGSSRGDDLEALPLGGLGHRHPATEIRGALKLPASPTSPIATASGRRPLLRDPSGRVGRGSPDRRMVHEPSCQTGGTGRRRSRLVRRASPPLG